MNARRRQHGQMILVLALSFALFLFAVIALVADSAYLYVWSARVQAAAQVAAQAGANAVDPQYIYGSSDHLVDLNASGGLMAFERGCVEVGDESAQLSVDGTTLRTANDPQPAGDGVRCVSDGCQVFASVEKTVHLPLAIFGESVVVRGVYYAAPVIGAQRAAPSTCVAGGWASEPPTRVP